MLNGMDIIACTSCGEVTLNRGDLERMAGKKKPGPAPIGGFHAGGTLVPDLGPPQLTASDPPPPPRRLTPGPKPSPRPAVSPTLTPAKGEFEIPREIEYFQNAEPRAITPSMPPADLSGAPALAPPPTPAPGPVAAPPIAAPMMLTPAPAPPRTDELGEEAETQLFRGTMGLEDKMFPPAADEFGFPPQTDEIPTTLGDLAEFAGRPETETQEAGGASDSAPASAPSALPGDRSIPETPAFGLGNIEIDGPYSGGGIDYDGDPVDDDDEDDFLAHYHAARRRRRMITVGILLMLMLAGGAPIVGFMGYQAVVTLMAAGETVAAVETPAPTVETPPAGDGTPVETPPVGDGTAPPTDGTQPPTPPAEPPAAVEEPPEEDKPPPEPVKEPVKKVTKKVTKKAPLTTGSAGGGGSVSGLVNAGWKKVGTDDAAAVALFEKALAKDSSHADANYGLGYALLSMGNTSGAQKHLCKALSGGDVGINREVNGLLQKNSLSCN